MDLLEREQQRDDMGILAGILVGVGFLLGADKLWGKAAGVAESIPCSAPGNAPPPPRAFSPQLRSGSAPVSRALYGSPFGLSAPRGHSM